MNPCRPPPPKKKTHLYHNSDKMIIFQTDINIQIDLSDKAKSYDIKVFHNLKLNKPFILIHHYMLVIISGYRDKKRAS